jgi:hypothetical protein
LGLKGFVVVVVVVLLFGFDGNLAFMVAVLYATNVKLFVLVE